MPHDGVLHTHLTMTLSKKHVSTATEDAYVACMYRQSQLGMLDPGLLNFAMVRNQYASSRKRTSDFEVPSFPELAVRSSLVMLVSTAASCRPS